MAALKLARTLKTKVVLHLFIGLAAAVLIFTIVVIRHHRSQLLAEAFDAVSQLSDVITQSTRFAMLQNHRSSVYEIVKNVGSEDRIERVRVLSKEGLIIHSSHVAEIAEEVGISDPGCASCHRSGKTPDVADARSSWISSGDGDERFLGQMTLILNEPSCYRNVLCHGHRKEQKVLGVLEITYSLSSIDETMRHDTMTIAGLSLGLVLVASLFAGFYVHRMVYTPLRDLEQGATRLRTGNLNELIPVRSRDEFGHLASSFNSMMLALRNSELELQRLNQTLEEKVKDKTKELQIAEAKAAHAEKLASVGLLAAGIAHELNNPLTGVLTFSHLLRKKFDAGSSEAEDLDLVIRETKRCSGIIKRLLDFAREKKPEKKYTDINQLIRETEQIVHHPVTFRDVDLELDLDDRIPPLFVDPDQIKQVLMNIFVNAQDAIEAKGSINVRSRLLGAAAGRPEMAEISVSDTGAGIASDDLRRIFDPFFTTKGVGRGTGLGLSVSYGIIRAHGGGIEVESTPGYGTTFHIRLPLEKAPAGAQRTEHEGQHTGS
jgi:two-component system NtrC family sensor kinase